MSGPDQVPELARTIAVRGRPSREQREALGKRQRGRVRRSALAEVSFGGRGDPIDLLEQQARTRVPELVPIRYGRMSRSAFAFFRGAALVMADDLGRSPSTRLFTQLCGDAHMSNFGVFATPERRLVFDVNDFDETYPGPFEWDVKRLAASLVVGALDRGFSEAKGAAIARAAAAEYRERLRELAGWGNLAVHYAHVDVEEGLARIGSGIDPEIDSKMQGRVRSGVRKARGRDSAQVLGKLTEVVDGSRRIVSDPPLIVPIGEVFSGEERKELEASLGERMNGYRGTLSWEVRRLLDQFTLVQWARKVVGVGSVGTRCWIALFRGVDDSDPLFLQIKEAQPSVLAGYVRGPEIGNQGHRVVNGQRLMQEASDIFLGWNQGPGVDGVVRDFYVRQLRDGKWSVDIETLRSRGLMVYGRLCARVLAQAHARSGNRCEIAGYLGPGSAFESAIADFAVTYSRRNAEDYAALLAAIDDGRIEARADL